MLIPPRSSLDSPAFANGTLRLPSANTNGHSRHGPSMTRDAVAAATTAGAGLGVPAAAEEEPGDDDPVQAILTGRWREAESRIQALFDKHAKGRRASLLAGSAQNAASGRDAAAAEPAKTAAPAKKAARTIDEDDYGDDQSEEEEEVTQISPLKSKGKAPMPNGISVIAMCSPPKATPCRTSISTSAADQAKSSEDVRKELEDEKKAAAHGAKRSFQSMFYTLESDRDAMLEQQKLDELDREVESEMSGPNASSSSKNGEGSSGQAAQGTLGSADLGASSLTLKHLIARIDAKRDMVRASDNQLRTLISEVRKGRSKWASEERVGQEELYETAEKVLMELKAMTEHAQPFLQRVNKRDAPDYFVVIKHPMDLGTMIKKLKQYAYKSKKEFCDDLALIWANCLKYNQESIHPLRKKALFMRKESEKLIMLIPDIIVRDRAEVEAEERRMQGGDGDGGEDSDDDAPIMASRGRKAPKKGNKGAPSTTRKAPAPVVAVDGTCTPAPESKPVPMHTSASNRRNEFLRAESDAPGDASSAGFSTPPPGPGTATPSLINGICHTDVMEVDGLGNSVMSTVTPEDADEDDADYNTWKQVTKKDRAMAAAERNRLFRADKINPEEPALLRSKAAMRRWMRQQREYAHSGKPPDAADAHTADDGIESSTPGETLAEGIEKDEDRTLPDYYDPLSAIPDMDERWKWTEDSEGQVVPQVEDYLRVYPKDQFKSNAEGGLVKKMEANMRQMQDTRKICAKIGIVRQMQIQTQTYQNQFQKYDPLPFIEQDVGPIVVSEDGPLMAPWVVRAAMQRSVGKIFYHAGFEDFQPSALDAVTDVAGEFFQRLLQRLKTFGEQPKVDVTNAVSLAGANKLQPRFTSEEVVLHALSEEGIDLQDLDAYVTDDMERLSTKLGVVHERMKSHLADLLRPALGDHAGADGVGAFNDGSEQFVGGDFAEDLDEDFFGFKELGLAEELGLETLSVPLHLLQNRMHSAYQAQNQGPIAVAGTVFAAPPPYANVTAEGVGREIELAQDFFRAKLRANRGEALVEDEDLPQKQRFPKPRLPPTGKISSPRKRPIREQQQAAKKKRKLEEGREEASAAGKTLGKPVGALRLEMPRKGGDDAVVGEPEKNAEDGGELQQGNGPAMISPESLGAT